VLTGIAALLTAVITLFGLLHQTSSKAPLNEAPAATADASAPSQPQVTANGAVSGVAVQGPLTMRSGDFADLTQGTVGNSVRDADLYLQRNGLGDFQFGAMGGGSFAPSETPHTRQSCVAALRARRDTFEMLSQLTVGTWLCMQTKDGRVALLHLVALPTVGAQQLTLSRTVWR
jgi:hypothetical protein